MYLIFIYGHFIWKCVWMGEGSKEEDEDEMERGKSVRGIGLGREREREQERDRSYPLVHSSHFCNKQGWARQKSRSG